MEEGSSSNGGGGMMMMGLYGENSNSTINGVFCPMMFMSSNSTNTNTSSSYHLLQLPSTTDAGHRFPAARGVYLMDTDGAGGSGSSVRAKIMAHPHYPRLLAAYANCQKVGAPPEVVLKLDEVSSAAAGVGLGGGGGCIGEDPALDQFMEAYCELLSKYEQELSRPYKEAMVFLQRFEAQFKTLTVASLDHSGDLSEAMDRSSEEEVDANYNSFIDPSAEDRDLKNQLLQKYSGYLGSLKQEFMKKRKKGKLPKEARQQLLDWWSRHYKWPYPSESQKVALAESTGLDQKQINNWFINQRKRHWKPSEDMQFMVMDAAAAHQHHPHYYLQHVLPNNNLDLSHLHPLN